MRSALLDTGVLVALLDRSERNHDRCVEAFRDFPGKLLTTEPVLTEAVYLLGLTAQGKRRCLEFIIEGGATLVPQSPESLSRAIVLIEKYHDVPMDFVDAALVVLAEQTGIAKILTLDLRGFSSYRIGGKRAFTVRPVPES